MILTWWQKLAKRTRTAGLHGSQGQLGSKPYRRLQLEWLENRLAPATHTWTGATSALWSVDTNWNGGSPAADPNAVLTFPAGAANLSNTNDLTNLMIQSIAFTGGADYTLGGNSITLDGGGITLDSTVTAGTTTINLPIALAAAQTWTVTNASRILQVGGVISGNATASLTKDGMGTLILTADNTYTGTTTVAGGLLLVNGSQPGSNVTVNSAATLGGSGTVGSITTSGIISPGGPGPGILHSGNVTFNAGSSLVVQFNGTTPGTGFSQLNATGTVNLSGNPTLTVTLGSFTPSVGNTFMVITSTGAITGTFNGLAENSNLTVGGRTYRVNYQTNGVVLTAGTANTQTVVTSSPNPSSFGQPVTFTATVTSLAPGSGVPVGTVTFRDGSNPLGTATLSATGTATFTTTNSTPLSGGTHSITAVFAGNNNFATSISTALSQTVNPAATTLTLTSSANPSVSGGPVTFTATVSSTVPATAGTPTGTITFREGSNTLGTASVGMNGVATFTPSTPLSTGTHTLTATYSGDSNFATSTSQALTQTVTAALSSTTTVVTSSLNPASVGQTVTFTATVSAGAGARGTPTGTVSFRDGTTTLGTATLSGGQATLSTSSLTAGTHSITAVYSGDNTFSGSTSLALVQTISQPTGTLNQNYVTQLYRDVLRRAPDPGGLQFWTGVLDQNRSTRFQVAMAFVNSTEYRMLEVQDVYRTFLHRAADPIGLNGWTQFLLRGNTLEQLEAQIVASPEYFQTRASGNTTNFLATLFMDAFNRPIDQAGHKMFDQEDVGNSEDRRRLAERIFATDEFRQDIVQSDYRRFLNRSADPGGLAAAEAALKNGVRSETVIAVIVSSPEYLANRVATPA